MSELSAPASGVADHPRARVNRGAAGALVAAVSGMMFAPSALIASGLSLFLTAISMDLGWSRTTFSLVTPLIAWTHGALAPFYGRLMDRFGLRRVLIPAIAAFGLSFLGVGLLTHDIWQFFLAFFVVGAAAGGLGPTGYNKLLSQWFTKSRGRAMALCAAAGSGMGSLLAPQIINLLIKTQGWRGAYVGLALMVLCISLPIAFFFMRERGQSAPEKASVQEETARHSAALEGLTFREGIRSPVLWMLALVLFLPGTAYYGILVHFVPIVTDHGFTRDVAATALSLLAVGAIGGQLAASVLLDRVSSPRVALPFLVCGMMGVLLIQAASTIPAFILAGMLIGIGQGSENSVVAYMTSRLLGLKSFGSLFGLMFGVLTFGAGSGPLLMGYVFDKTGSYRPVLLALDVAIVVAIIIAFFLPPYVYGRKAAAELPLGDVENG